MAVCQYIGTCAERLHSGPGGKQHSKVYQALLVVVAKWLSAALTTCGCTQCHAQGVGCGGSHLVISCAHQVWVHTMPCTNLPMQLPLDGGDVEELESKAAAAAAAASTGESHSRTCTDQ